MALPGTLLKKENKTGNGLLYLFSNRCSGFLKGSGELTKKCKKEKKKSFAARSLGL
jgi:hypothetical protein